MINGQFPIIIFHLYSKPKYSIFGPKTEYQSRLDDLSALVGIPIVIPLSEELTGIYIDTESHGIRVVTNVDPTTDKDPLTGDNLPPTVTQTGSDSDVNITMLANRGSVMLTAFLAVAQVLVSKLVTAEYAITYLNGPTVIFNGLLSSFNTATNRNDTLVRIDLSISTAKKDAPKLETAKAGLPPVANTAGTALGPAIGG